MYCSEDKNGIESEIWNGAYAQLIFDLQPAKLTILLTAEGKAELANLIKRNEDTREKIDQLVDERNAKIAHKAEVGIEAHYKKLIANEAGHIKTDCGMLLELLEDYISNGEDLHVIDNVKAGFLIDSDEIVLTRDWLPTWDDEGYTHLGVCYRNDFAFVVTGYTEPLLRDGQLVFRGE